MYIYAYLMYIYLAVLSNGDGQSLFKDLKDQKCRAYTCVC